MMLMDKMGGQTPSTFQLFMVSVKLFFGISYLSMPNTFAHCGLAGGIILFTVVIFLNLITMMQLMTLAEHFHGVQSYSDLGLKILGPKGKLAIDLCIMVKQIGTCITYLFFVSTLLDFAVCQSADKCYGRDMYILILIAPVIVISCANSYKVLSYLSIPSIIIAISGMICIFAYSFS